MFFLQGQPFFRQSLVFYIYERDHLNYAKIIQVSAMKRYFQIAERRLFYAKVHIFNQCNLIPSSIICRPSISCRSFINDLESPAIHLAQQSLQTDCVSGNRFGIKKQLSFW